MELTKEQLLQIDNYIFSCGIKFIDIRAEIVDHFANILEQKLEENPTLNFKQEIINIHKNFSENGFKKLLKEKTKSVQKRFYKASLKHLITFFRFPKIIVSGGFFYFLILIMNLVEDKEVFFSILSFILLFLGFRLLFNVNMRNSNKQTFLVLNMTLNFFNSFYLLVMIFNFSASHRIIGSFFNFTDNYIYLGIFTLLILFYWSGEYVYYQNKKEVIKQYPNLVV
ncbi:MAG: hypothetical protein ACI921_001969 [Polaribacter sp.]|jgi:hypothetical protein|tara:strand:+ start:41 stop:715 length:675 start_codon:yes stop_codon:yes gene_type:complete